MHVINILCKSGAKWVKYFPYPFYPPVFPQIRHYALASSLRKSTKK